MNKKNIVVGDRIMIFIYLFFASISEVHLPFFSTPGWLGACNCNFLFHKYEELLSQWVKPENGSDVHQKIVELHKIESGCKKIAKELNVSLSTKWSFCHDCPSPLTWTLQKTSGVNWREAPTWTWESEGSGEIHMEEWSLISCQVFSKLRHYRRRLRAVILAKGDCKK